MRRCIEATLGVICILVLIDPATAQGRDANARIPVGVETNVISFLWDAFRGVPNAFMAGLMPAKAPPERVASSPPKPINPDAVHPPDLGPQRVVLYEEDPAHPKGVQYVGTVVWRLEPVKKNGSDTREIAVRGDIDIPARQIKMTFLFRKNADAALPASHLAELTFILGPDFAGGGIANVPGLLTKFAEQARGTPFAGLMVKVTESFFLMGFSNVESDRTRNLQLLRERSWFDIPVVYKNQRRAIIAIDRGRPGDSAFLAALEAWDNGVGESSAR